MTITDEPGYYDEEKGFGVRIENTLYILKNGALEEHLTKMTVDSGLEKTYQNRQFLRFDVLSFVPIQADLCIKELLTEEEKLWLYKYNSVCLEKMKGYISDPEVISWLEKQVEQSSVK